MTILFFIRSEYAFLPVGGIFELLGVLTLVTNEESMMPYADIGLEIPIFVGSADVQGFGLFILGAILTSYAVLQLQK